MLMVKMCDSAVLLSFPLILLEVNPNAAALIEPGIATCRKQVHMCYSTTTEVQHTSRISERTGNGPQPVIFPSDRLG